MNKREFRQLVCAMLLGDSWLYVAKTPRHTGAVLGTEHSSDQEDYLLWKKSQLDNIFIKKGIDRRCRVYHRTRKHPKSKKYYSTVQLHLSWKKYFTFLHGKVYRRDNDKIRKNVKFLLRNISADKHLAIWFMDDGNEAHVKAKHKDGTEYWRNPYLRLCINSFTFGEAELIKQWFEQNHDISPSVTYTTTVKGEKQPVIQFSVKDNKRLFPKIRPYVNQIESMRTKFRVCLERY